MKRTISDKREEGFSLIELVVCMLILLPAMGAALSLFSVGTRQQTEEHGNIDANQEARAGLEMMITEIAQAGSHGDWATTLNSGISGSTDAQTVKVDSAEGFTVGDWVDVGTGANLESVEIIAVAETSISGVFIVNHDAGDPVRLFALPYAAGVIPSGGMGPNAQSTATTLRFFGDINGDSTIQYVEYVYDIGNNQITRSITPIGQGNKSGAVPFIRNISRNSARFTLSTDGMGVVTSVGVEFTVQNSQRGVASQDTQMASHVTIPSTIAASALTWEQLMLQSIVKLPTTPAEIISWAGYDVY